MCLAVAIYALFYFSAVLALTLLVGRQEGHLACKNGGMVEVGNGWFGWSSSQPDG